MINSKNANNFTLKLAVARDAKVVELNKQIIAAQNDNVLQFYAHKRVEDLLKLEIMKLKTELQYAYSIAEYQEDEY